ncbi:MAG: helix-turn-helix transcriptional regulator [Oscillospiraceae bacterium]|nr:helix-turn-helix transcriptional regulator [Oscillospiraceae bacterium]
MNNFNERLVELRTEKGISQKNAAADLEISQALLSHYEKGIREYSLSFLCKAAEYYGVTTDYILGFSNSRTGVSEEIAGDIDGDEKFTTATVYRAAMMTMERMSAGSSNASDTTDLLFAAIVYRVLFASAQKGYIPKRWFSVNPKYVQPLSLALTEFHLNDFPEKIVTARRYGGPQPKSIETVIKKIEATMRKGANNV